MSGRKRGEGRSIGRGLRRIHSAWLRGLEREAVWIVLLVLLGTMVLLPLGELLEPRAEVGRIAQRDYLAQREMFVLDEEATRAQRQRAREAVLPVYDYDPLVAPYLDDQLAQLFQAGRRQLEVERAVGEGESSGSAEDASPPTAAPAPAVAPTFQERLQASTYLSPSSALVDTLRAREFGSELEERVRGLVDAVLGAGVVDDKTELLENRLSGITLRNRQTLEESARLDLYDYRGRPDEIAEYFESEIRRWPGWKRAEREALVTFLVESVPPNIYLNRTETASRREAAAEQAEQVGRQIRQGQIIVRRGDVIDPPTAASLAELEGSGPRLGLVGMTFGSALLMALIAWFLRLAVRMESGRRTLGPGTFGGIALLFVLALISAELGLVIGDGLADSFTQAPFESPRGYRYAVPYAALALIVSLFYGRPLGILTGVAFAVVAGRLAGGDGAWAVLFVLTGSMAAVYSLHRLKERSAVTRAGLTVAAVNGVGALMLAALFELPDGPAVLGWHVLLAMVGGILVAAVAAFSVPILEGVLAVTTDMRLIELSDTNLPLLRRLAFEAPGTFQHSLMVANLAKVGSEAIGANAILAYTAGLYHDVGKLPRPQYFAENQPHGLNPHDKLAPSMSALIVISHVRDGVELAQEHHLPEPLIDAIRQHHGTRKLTFFYERAVERSGDRESSVAESDYRYPGPRPENKVMGVLMLADGVEAASRVLRNPTSARIRNLVEQIVEDCLADGQLDATDLTLGDLSEVKRAFCRVLESIYHKRVEYPGFDFNREDHALRVIEGGARSS